MISTTFRDVNPVDFARLLAGLKVRYRVDRIAVFIENATLNLEVEHEEHQKEAIAGYVKGFLDASRTNPDREK